MATNTTITQTALPDWYTQYAKTLLEKAYGATSQPYQTYDAPRIASFSPEQQQAFQMVKDNTGIYQPAISSAMQAAQAGAAKFTDPGVAASYMNPYTANVVDDIGKLAARNLSENLLPQVNQTFVGSGTFGGSRSADFTARAVRDANESALTQQNAALQAGYNNAAGQFNNDATRSLQSGQLQAGIGATQQQLAGTDAAAMEAVGQQKQALAQKSADLAYSDFQNQRDYPLTQVQQLQQIGGTPSPAGASTSTVTAPSPNGTAQAVGTILGGIGTLGNLFGIGKKEGGVIRRHERRGIGGGAPRRAQPVAMRRGIGSMH